jgi:hypothetical protein
MLALSGMADRGGGPRRSPVEIIATMGSYVTRTQAAEVSGLRAGPFGRWADGVTAMREDCAVFARHWQAHNDRVLTGDGPLWVVLGDSTAQGLGAPGPDHGYVGQVLTGLRQRALRDPDQPDYPPVRRRPGPAGRRGLRALHAALARQVRLRLLPSQSGRPPRLGQRPARRRAEHPGARAGAKTTGAPAGRDVTLAT